MTDPKKKTATAVATVPAIPVEEPAKPQPHRFRVSVPAADEAVLAWMGLQDNPSLSVRMLIRESIERLGYVDLVNRPVTQLPKRGRPFSVDGGADHDEGSAIDDRRQGADIPLPVSPAAGLPAPAAVAPVHTPAQPDFPRADQDAHVSRDLDLSENPEAAAANATPELLGIALEAPTRVNEAPAPTASTEDDADPASPDPEPGSDGQIEVNDIFQSLR